MRYASFVVAALAFIVIAPALWTGWSGDDAFYSALDGVLAADHTTLWHAMLHSFDLWLFGNGRFYPGLVVEKYLVFFLFTNLVAYKVFLIVATLAVLELFRRTVGAYTTEPAGNLAALLAATLFVQRGYHDPVLAYNAMPQCVAACMLLSLLLFRRWPDGRAPVRLASIGLYLLAAITYEDAFALCLLYPLLAWMRGERGKPLAYSSLPFLSVAAVLGLFSMMMRAAAHVPAGSMYSTNLSLPAVARTDWYQISAAFPLSYWLFDPQRIFDRSTIQAFYRNAPVSPLVFVAFAVTGYFMVRDAVRVPADAKGLAIAGAAVAVLPALPLAIVTKYQHELMLGLGYLPVFFQIPGVALIGVAVATAVVRWRNTRATIVALAGAIAICGTMTQATNNRVALGGIPSRDARAALQRELGNGLLAGVPDGATIGVNASFDWIALDDAGPDGISTRGLFFMYGRKRVVLAGPRDPRAGYILSFSAKQNLWSLSPVQPVRS